ncbi:AMP-binding enzyme [Patellaria atrata CBS 101060]|uniref:Very long-chain fatty acid transport protein n=1 Tax=Patellaria atrata CBS 101060 TaxID=1346257 RepID=A0A9P4S0U3_9PEZI|nr:AMP-binding enzyme [Patellaria atrata CBS 101060]
MTSIPLTVTLPAITAAAAYLNARLSLSYDLNLVAAFGHAFIKTTIAQSQDELNFFNVLASHARSNSQRHTPFLVFNGKSYTYQESYQNAIRYATWLKIAYNVQKGEIVAIDHLNSDTFVWLWFGLWALGAKPAFINYNLRESSLVHCIKASSARLLLVDAEIQAKFTDSIREDLRDVIITILAPEILNEIEQTKGQEPAPQERQGQDTRDMAMLIYTSGTTGLPKPAVVSWSKVRGSARIIAGWLPLKQGDRFYTSMPLYHSSASLLGVCATLDAGTTIIIGRKFSVKSFWNEVRESEANIIQYVGETCRYLLSAPPSPLDKQHKVFAALGNGLRPDVWDKFKDRFGIEQISEFYAATEGVAGFWNKSRNDFSKAAIGRNGAIASLIATRFSAVIKLDQNYRPLRDARTGRCIQCKRKEPGELIFKLNPEDVQRHFQGYFGPGESKEATEKKILRSVFRKGDAWFSTGDMVKRDKENNYYFLDRVGDTFRWKSENVSTAEVSAILGSHVDVKEANVYGVEVPGHDGRAGCAAIVLRDYVEEAKIGKTLESLGAHVRGKLPRYAVPVFIRVVRHLKATGTNKHQKTELRSQGVEPGRCDLGEGESLWWLKDGRYVSFGSDQWEELKAGAKL